MQNAVGKLKGLFWESDTSPVKPVAEEPAKHAVVPKNWYSPDKTQKWIVDSTRAVHYKSEGPVWKMTEAIEFKME